MGTLNLIKFIKMAGRWVYGLMPDGTPEEAQELAQAGVLFAPAKFLNEPKERLGELCNGCGAQTAKFDFVPDSIWFLYIGHACHIHDAMYHYGTTIEDKEEADRVFLNNMCRIIDLDKSWWRSKKKMKKIAYGYWWAVDKFGGSPFWHGKNK